MSPQPRASRALLRGTVIYGIGAVIPRLGVFLLLPVYTLGMGSAEFGVFALMLSLAGLLTLLVRLGLDGALLRLHYDVEETRRGRLYWTAATITVGAGAVLAIVLLPLAGPLFDVVFPGIAVVPYGVLAVAIAALAALHYIPATHFRATDRPGRFVALGIAMVGVAAIATLWLVLGVHLGALGGLVGQLAGAGIVVIVGGAVVVRLRPIGFDVAAARSGLAFGLPLVPHSIAGWVLNLSDRWLIGLLIGLPAIAAQQWVGIYSLGYQLGQVVALVALALNTAWVPFFYARGEGPDGPALLREMSSLSIGALAVLAVLVGVLAPDIVALLAPPAWGPDAATAGVVAPLVAMASLAQGVYLMAVSPLFLRRRTAVLPLLTAAAAAANVGLNALLIPRLGVVGAGWATIAGYGVLALGTAWYARRGYPLRLDLTRLSALLIGAAAAIVAARSVSPPEPLPGVLVHLAVAGGFALLVLPAVRGPLRRARRLVDAPAPVPPLAGSPDETV